MADVWDICNGAAHSSRSLTRCRTSAFAVDVISGSELALESRCGVSRSLRLEKLAPVLLALHLVLRLHSRNQKYGETADSDRRNAKAPWLCSVVHRKRRTCAETCFQARSCQDMPVPGALLRRIGATYGSLRTVSLFARVSYLSILPGANHMEQPHATVPSHECCLATLNS